jgi:AhpD family alkylhydroperoxidase
MGDRMDWAATNPDGMKAVLRLEQHLRTHLDHRLYELVKLRASMVNGCSFCVDMHGSDLLAAGEPARRVLAVSAWREATSLFTGAERAALALTDAVTELGPHGVPDDVWDEAVAAHGPEVVSELLLAIATINVWNRISITTRNTPPPLEQDEAA